MILSTLAILSMFAQIPAVEPTVRVNTRLVEVNVVVRNKNGPIDDLKKDDFTILDHGSEQKIATFAKVSSKEAARASVPLPTDIYSNRTEHRTETPTGVTVILFDALNTQMADQAHARDQVVSFLKQMGPRDRIALYSLGSDLRVLQDFTDDPKDLIRKLAKHVRVATEVDASEPDPSNTGNSDLDKFLDEASGKIADLYINRRIEVTLGALESLAHHVGYLPGRKNVVWITSGFPFSIGPQTMNLDTTRAQGNYSSEIARATRVINEANIAIYPVDARGLTSNKMIAASSRTTARQARTNSGSSDFFLAGLDTMQILAERTGGKAFYNTNDISRAVREAVNDAEVSYTIGYYPDIAKLDGRFREIKVKVERKGAELRYRKGYFALPDEPQSDGKEKREVGQGIISPLDATAIPLLVRFDHTAAKPQLVMVVEPRGVNIDRKGDRFVGSVGVIVAQLSAEGKLRGGSSDDIQINVDQAGYNKMMTEGILIYKSVQIQPEVLRIRALVVDHSSGAMGSVTIPAQVK